MHKRITVLLAWTLLLALVPKPALADDRPVLVFVGMPGSGKSTAVGEIADRLGAPRWSSGDVIRQARSDRGLAQTAENDRQVARSLAADPGSVGRLLAETVERTTDPLVLVEGFRTTADLEAFRRSFPNTRVISVEVGAERRYGRMLQRQRVGENNVEFLRSRDRAETQLGVRDVMRGADYRIRPRGNNLPALRRSLERVLQRINPALARGFRRAPARAR